jgi:hypothetical protein
MADDFNDIDLTAFGTGALGGVGADDHFASRQSSVPEGVRFEIVCDTCGQRQHVIVSWDELIFVSQGQPPPGTPHSPPWAYSQRHGALHPNIPCCSCQRRDTLVMLTPDEAMRHLRAGTQAQYVTPAYVANAIRQVQGMASGYRP